MSAVTRKAPNVFNLMRQLRVLQRAGVASEAETVAWLQPRGLPAAV